jgi:hypothetical protein
MNNIQTSLQMNPTSLQKNLEKVQEKNYRVKEERWFCTKCNIYCNSDSQFQVHMMSTKHKTAQANASESETVIGASSVTAVTNESENEKVEEVTEKLATRMFYKFVS